MDFCNFLDRIISVSPNTSGYEIDSFGCGIRIFHRTFWLCSTQIGICPVLFFSSQSVQVIYDFKWSPCIEFKSFTIHEFEYLFIFSSYHSMCKRLAHSHIIITAVVVFFSTPLLNDVLFCAKYDTNGSAGREYIHIHSESDFHCLA